MGGEEGAAEAAAPDVTALNGAAMAGVPITDPAFLQMMQQQALAAALAGGGAGMAGLQIALPPGVTLEQASLMGLPIMALPVALPPGAPAAGAAGLPGALPKATAPAKPASVSRGAGSGADDEYTATGRRKRKDTGGPAPAGRHGAARQLGSYARRRFSPCCAVLGMWLDGAANPAALSVVLSVRLRALADRRQAAAAVTQLD